MISPAKFFWLTLLVLLVWTSQTDPRELPRLSNKLVGSELAYAVQWGDSLTSVGARFGVAAATLARDNGLEPTAHLKEGQVLRLDNRHIVPGPLENGILINIPQRMLFYFDQGTLVSQYPVGLGRPSWPTPTGTFKILTKEENPVWDVPKSIQEEMRREGKVVRTKMPPCPENPLGQYWMGLSMPGYGIHGTIAPNSIYQFRTHGCIRLHPDDISDLFGRVQIDTPGKIIYEPVLLARIEHDRFYLEVHRDVYKRAVDLLKTLRGIAAAHEITLTVDWERVEEVVRRKDGVAREITKR